MAKKKARNVRKTDTPRPEPAAAVFQSSVLQLIRRHARSAPKTEVCGVLIGRHSDGRTRVVGAIKGREADQGEAHVTFTQETWVKIHEEKDAKYPTEAIVGWYHSHPGFGVFLSDHDLFIHKNFFSGEGQLAWVVDPHTEEEGCWGWEEDEIRKIQRIELIAEDTGEPLGQPEPTVIKGKDEASDWSQETPYSFKELAHDLSMMAFGAVLLLATVFLWLNSPWAPRRQVPQYRLVPIEELRRQNPPRFSPGTRPPQTTRPAPAQPPADKAPEQTGDRHE